jgi:hypothetical protein
MKTFFSALKFILTSAGKNAIKSPKTTMTGVVALISGIKLLSNNPAGPEEIAFGITSMLTGATLLLANDPKSENDKK